MVFILGANDAKYVNWSDEATFEADYKEIAQALMNVSSWGT